MVTIVVTIHFFFCYFAHFFKAFLISDIPVFSNKKAKKVADSRRFT